MLSADKRRLEPSAHVVSKVNAILFKLDQGPASNLLGNSNSSDHHDDVVVPNEEDEPPFLCLAEESSPDAHQPRKHPPPPTSEIRFPNPAMADYHFHTSNQQGISPYHHDQHRQHQQPPDDGILSPTRSVHFDASMATSYVLDEEIVQLRHTAAIVAVLQKKLKTARTELVTERTNRKRKEKNLIKLAKEMNSRAHDHAVNDQKVEEMEESIADLTGRLTRKSQTEIPHLQLLLQQKEMALSECQARSERQLAELQQAQKDAAAARQELIEVVVTSTSQQQKTTATASSQQSTATPDEKMVEMEETIDDLEGRLALYQHQELPRLQRLVEQKELALAECQAAMERQRAEWQQARHDYTASVLRRDERLVVVDVIQSDQSEATDDNAKIVAMEATIADLERQLAQYNQNNNNNQELPLQETMALSECRAESDRQERLELPQARRDEDAATAQIGVITSPTATDTSREVLVQENTSSSQRFGGSNSGSAVTLVQQVLFYVVVLLALSIAFWRSSYVHPAVLDMACAPLPPGSFVPAAAGNNNNNNHHRHLLTLHPKNEVRTFRAPYWVPDRYKREVFAVICPGRSQTVLHQVNGKVEILRDGERAWKGRARGGFHVEQDKIVLMGGRHHDKIVHEVKGPWTL
jgi:hypothetical protein